MTFKFNNYIELYLYAFNLLKSSNEILTVCDDVRNSELSILK